MNHIAPALKRSINLFQATLFRIRLILCAEIYFIIGEAAGIAGYKKIINIYICRIFDNSC
jgi:hypothetical protein